MIPIQETGSVGVIKQSNKIKYWINGINMGKKEIFQNKRSKLILNSNYKHYWIGFGMGIWCKSHRSNSNLCVFLRSTAYL